MAEIYKIGSDDIVDRVSEFGGTNLLETTSAMVYSKDTWSGWFTPAANTNNNCLAGFHDLIFPTETIIGDKFVFTFEYEWTKFTAGTGGAFTAPYIQWYANNSWSSGITTPLAHTTPATVAEVTAGAGSKIVHIYATITAENQITANWYANFRTNYSNGTGQFRIRRFKLEKGNKPTDWTPAPQDLVTVSGTELQFF